MSEPPPENLMDWPKAKLAKEVRRLRALTREHARQPGAPRRATTDAGVVDVAGDPYAEGGALVDARSAVLIDSMDVVLVDTKQDEPLAMFLSLAGRINYSSDRVEHVYLYGPDGAAAFVTQHLGLAKRAQAMHAEHGKRFSEAFQTDVNRRLAELP